ncbi:MAG: T9SS type A sorting domain-containing protein [Candidatus Cloacimonetes bacterium]|nr:T9SS type A sorting domain-containing protein [Candidatus Cloacimonadota bacterium]
MKLKIISILSILIIAQLCTGLSFTHFWGKITGRYRVDTVELPPPSVDNGWKWLSFPALDNVLTDADIADNVLGDILDPTILDKVEAHDYTIDYNIGTQTWNNSSEQFSRTEGFKFHMNAAADLNVPGFLEYPMTQISLIGNQEENWIGYWLEETQHVSDAFSGYWDASNIYFIHHQNWTAFYLGRWRIQLYSGRLPTLSYGDMVIVKCLTTINDFQWDTGLPVEKTLIAETEYFTYEEQADYVPLYIELDSSNMPQEIGVFVNGECIGASVVEDSLSQINVYSTSVPPGNIELELYYGNRSENKQISSYNCVTSTNPDLVMKQLTTEDKDDAWFINLREGSEMIPEIIEFSASNYPNPFNPETTIAYSLPNDGMIELRVFNIRGQLVKTLVKGEQLAGSYETVWNGKDNNEKSVSSGIYFYKLSTKDDTIMKKMLMLK